MRVIPVIDLKANMVVRAIAGQRETYRPITSPLVRSAVAQVVAQAFVDQFGLDEFYVADLDAIDDGPPALDLYAEILEIASRLILDAGLCDARRAERLAEFAAEQTRLTGIVVGLESLKSSTELAEIVEILGTQRAVFSLDLRQGIPITRSAEWSSRSPREVVERVVAAGFQRLIVLDLADVGCRGGTTTLTLCRQLRGEFPQLELIAGGGVRGPDDLTGLEMAGCQAALVASALHDGGLRREHLTNRL